MAIRVIHAGTGLTGREALRGIIRDPALELVGVYVTTQDKVGQDGVSSAMGRALKRAHVTVDPRYGRWNAKRAIVCAPNGCPPASASGG